MQEMKEKYSVINGASRLLHSSDQINSSESSVSESVLRFCGETLRNEFRENDANRVLNFCQNASPLSSKSDTEDLALEDCIAYLIDGLSSPVISDDHFSYSSNSRYTKAALPSCISPTIAPDNKICDSDKNNHYNRYLQDKEHRMQVKQEYKEHKYVNEKMLSPGSARQSPVSDVENMKPLSGSLLTSDDVNVVAHSSRSNIQDATYVQSTVLVTRKSGTKSRRSHSYTACLDTTQNTNVPNVQRRIDYMNANVLSSNILYGGAANNIKMEPGIGRFICLDKQSSVLHYFGDDDGITGIKTQDRWPLKRIYSEEDLLAMHTKKRSAEAHPSTSTSDERQDYGSSFAAENEYPRAIELNNQCNDIDAQQLATTKSSELDSSESGDYQQLEPAATSLEGTNPELGLLDLVDLKEDLLLSSDLEADPGILPKIVRSFVINVSLLFK